MRGAADAEKGPPFCDGTVVELNRVSRDISVIRLQLDQPLVYYPGQYVTVQVPQWPRRWRYLSPAIPRRPRGWHRVPRPLGYRWNGQPHYRRRNQARRSVAAVQSARRHAGRQGRRRRADGRGQHRAGAAAGAHHGPHPMGREPEGPPVLRRALSLRTVRPADPVADRVEQPLAVGVTGVGVRQRPAMGRRLSRCATTPRAARAPDRQAARRW